MSIVAFFIDLMITVIEQIFSIIYSLITFPFLG